MNVEKKLNKKRYEVCNIETLEDEKVHSPTSLNGSVRPKLLASLASSTKISSDHTLRNDHSPASSSISPPYGLFSMRPQFAKLPCHSAEVLQDAGTAKAHHVRRVREQERKESTSSSDIGHRIRVSEASPSMSVERHRKGSLNALLNDNEQVGTKMSVQRFRRLEKEAEEDSRLGSSYDAQLTNGEKLPSGCSSFKRSGFALPGLSPSSPKKNVSFSPNLIMFVYKKD